MKITAQEMRDRTSLKRDSKLELAKNKVLTNICDNADMGNDFILINDTVWLGDELTDRFVFNTKELAVFISELTQNGFMLNEKDDGDIEIRW